MANTLTALAPVLFSAGKAVPRELVGVVPATRMDFDDKGVSVGSTVTVPVAPSQTKASVTAAQQFTIGSNRTAASKSVTLANFEETSWHLTAEEDRYLMNGSGNAQEMLRQTVEQGWRVLINAIELNAWTKCYKGSSRAVGTAGTTPFASTINVIPDIAKILKDNGVSVNDSDCSLVIDTAASAKLQSLAVIHKVNESGSADVLRRGVMGNLFGFGIRESAQIGVHTKGTGTLYQLSAAGAVGDTTINVDTGSGTLLAGDAITAAGTSDIYIANTALSGGTFTIGDPGLRAAEADNDAITIGNSYTANLAIHRNAAVTIVRPALQPEGAIAEQMVLTDPVTGLSCLFLRVPGNALTSYYMRVVYDTSVINSHMIATLMG